MMQDAEGVHHQASVYLSPLLDTKPRGSTCLQALDVHVKAFDGVLMIACISKTALFVDPFLYIIFVDAFVRKKLRVAFHGRNVLIVVRIYRSLLKVVTASVSGDRARTHV